MLKHRTINAPLVATLAAVVVAACPSVARGQDEPLFVPGEVVVKREGQPPQVVSGVSDVGARVGDLRERHDVEYAVPNAVAHASAFVPDDPGFGEGRGWQAVQWNLLARSGVNAPRAWQHAIDAGAPGGRGALVAVLDTGVAYEDRGVFRRSPDLDRTRFVPGYDFVDDDPYPNDEHGHGTHVASTIAQSTDNGVGLAGLAYGTSIMPVRVLDASGGGDAARIAEAVRFAARRGADVINLSLDFAPELRARRIPQLIDALADARRAGVLIVGAAGNTGEGRIALPARAPSVVAVGATTEHRCLSEFSNRGDALDIVAPGGGLDAALGDANCAPDGEDGRAIFQLTFRRDGEVRRFGYPDDYEGTSMAAPHVSATAALVIAARVLGPRPSPKDLVAHLKGTADDLGPAGEDRRYGAGLLDAGAATAPVRSARRARR